MSKPIVLTTGAADLNKLSGNSGFCHWFWNDFYKYLDQSKAVYDHDVSPLHIVLPIASVGEWQDELLSQLESVTVSRLHIEFQPFDHLFPIGDYFRNNATIYRKRIIDSLRERLERSNWDSIIITGLTQDECQDLIDLHLRLEVTVNYPVTCDADVVSEIKTIFKRAIL